HHTGFGRELSVPLDRGLDGLQPGAYPLPDHAALELSECACNLEDELSHRAGRVDVLLVEVEVDAGGLEVLDSAEQVDQGAAKPIDGPGHDNVELAPARVLQHGVQARTLITALGAADARIAVGLDHGPSAALGNLPELAVLALDRLVVSGHAQVQRHALLLAHEDPLLYGLVQRRPNPTNEGIPEELAGVPHMGFCTPASCSAPMGSRTACMTCGR